MHFVMLYIKNKSEKVGPIIRYIKGFKNVIFMLSTREVCLYGYYLEKKDRFIVKAETRD